MDQPLLIPRKSVAVSAAFAVAASAAFTAFALAAILLPTGCTPFEDPLLELDPALRDTSLAALPISVHRRVARKHILESFGSYGCVSCPDAESRLAPFIHADLGNPNYDANLVVVNYHVKFGSIADPWVTPSIQAWNDKQGYVSLPQAVMDGSNAQFGIREKDVAFKEGEYDSLAARARRAEGSTWLDLSIDTAGIAYDTASGRIRFGFQVRNLDTQAAGPMAFRVLVVKNKPAAIPIYPTPWEVIVMETTDADATGRNLSLAGLGGLTAKAFYLDMAVPSEAGKHPRPPPLGPETLSDYALVVLAQDANVVLNVAAFKYGPK